MEPLVWPDELRRKVKSAFRGHPGIRKALRQNDSALITLLCTQFGWECSGVPAQVTRLDEDLRAGKDIQVELSQLAERLERAAKTEALRQEAWTIVNDMVEGRPPVNS
jgi:hypothetical protein